MTIETLEKRVDGKKKAIEKLEKKIERIEKAKASGWENNPYWYTERDLEIAQRDLEAEKKALANYEDQLKAEIEKANSRNVKALVDFLEMWKTESIKWFREEKIRYDEALKEYYTKDHEYCDKWNYGRKDMTPEERKALDREWHEYRAIFRSTWSHITQFNHGSLSWDETLQKDIEIEKNRKYDDIIERTNEIVGTITDASNLKVSRNQNLNGYIIGEKGKAKVETIGAGGYNIQRFHFRTLVHEMK